MSLLLAPTQSNALISLRSFLLNVLPAGVEAVQGQPNRVPEVKSADFVVFTPTHRGRLATNQDKYVDCTFQGVVNALSLTVSGIQGIITVGLPIYGVTLPLAGAVIVAQVSGPAGGNGVYTMATGTPNAAAALMANGALAAMQETKLSVQLDVHGPNSADNAQIISTMFRDDYAVEFFAALGPDPVPLYADDPRQMPFVNENQQIEMRWIIDAVLQTNPVVTAPAQFADQLAIGVINVDAQYPPD